MKYSLVFTTLTGFALGYYFFLPSLTSSFLFFLQYLFIFVVHSYY